MRKNMQTKKKTITCIQTILLKYFPICGLPGLNFIEETSSIKFSEIQSRTTLHGPRRVQDQRTHVSRRVRTWRWDPRKKFYKSRLNIGKLRSFTSSYFHIFIFSSWRLHIFTYSGLVFTSAHLHIFSSSHLLILHLHILSSSHRHIFSFSHLRIFTSHLLICTSCILTCSLSLFSLSLSLSLLTSGPLLCPCFSILS